MAPLCERTPELSVSADVEDEKNAALPSQATGKGARTGDSSYYAAVRPWILAGLIGAIMVASSSGTRPWIDAASGAFNPPDIPQDVAAAHLFAHRTSPYGPAIRQIHSELTGLPISQTYPYFPHPPFSLIVSLFSAYVSLRNAALIWFAVSLALVFLLAALLAEYATRPENGEAAPVSQAVVLGLFGFLILWPPVLYNLEKGQWSLLLAVLIALGWRSLASGRQGQGGGLIGTAASVKVFPILLGGYLLMRSRRAFAWFLIVGAVFTAAPLLWIGWDAFPAFVRESQHNVPNWEAFPSVMYSIHGALARLFVGGEWARPAIHAPALVRWIEVPVTFALFGLAIAVTRRPPLDYRSARARASFAAWCVLLVVVNPQSMGHNGLLLALPFVVTARLLINDARRWPKLAWAAALILTSIPRQRLWPALTPVGPLKGIAVIALPMWGALVLFAVAIICARNFVREI